MSTRPHHRNALQASPPRLRSTTRNLAPLSTNVYHHNNSRSFRAWFWGHLLMKLWALVTFTYGIQIRHTSVRRNPLSGSLAYEESFTEAFLKTNDRTKPTHRFLKRVKRVCDGNPSLPRHPPCQPSICFTSSYHSWGQKCPVSKLPCALTKNLQEKESREWNLLPSHPTVIILVFHHHFLLHVVALDIHILGNSQACCLSPSLLLGKLVGHN